MYFQDLILNELDDVHNIYIYGYGIAGRWLYDNIPHKNRVKGFIDTDYKKSGVSEFGVNITTPQCLSSTILPDSIIINTVIDIQDVIDIVDKLRHRKALPLGLYLDDINELVHNNITGESDSFLNYSLSAVKCCHEGYFSTDKLFLRSIDLVITEKCSLKCKDCSNLMQYYDKPVDVSFSEIVFDFNKLTENIDGIFEVRLIGGEPFMNKDIYKILEYLYTKNNIVKIVVYSNAMIPIRQEYAHLLANEKLVFSLTDYGGLAKNTPRVVTQLEELGAAYRLHPPENWTDSGVIGDFKRDSADIQNIFANCCGKNLLTLSEGKLFRCPFSANADRLRAIPDDPLNYVSVDASPAELRHFSRNIKFLPACNYCKGRSFDSPSIVPATQALKPLSYIRFDR